jgi:hypothetical protein
MKAAEQPEAIQPPYTHLREQPTRYNPCLVTSWWAGKDTNVYGFAFRTPKAVASGIVRRSSICLHKA